MTRGAYLKSWRRKFRKPSWTPRGLIAARGALPWLTRSGVRCATRCTMAASKRIGSPCTASFGMCQRKWVSRRLETARVCSGKRRSARTCGKYGRPHQPMPRGYVKRKPKEEQRAVRRAALWKIPKSVRTCRWKFLRGEIERTRWRSMQVSSLRPAGL